MPLNIPIEDNYTDVVGKSQRGLGIDDNALAVRAGVALADVESLKAGEVHESVIRKVAAALGLGGGALMALATGAYMPEAVQEPEGLACFNSVFDDMTVNSFLVWDPSTKEGAFFDTGSDGQPMLDFASAHGLKVNQIFITHIHTDHIFDLDRLIEKTRAIARVCDKEPTAGAEPFTAGESFHLGGLLVETRATSGHAAGGITFVIRGLAKPVAVVGDAVFAGSMGGGMVSYADALRTNREEIYTLPDETIICPGHGPLTTVREQKRSNPFFTA